ncbi:MAG TPA: ATP-binding protein, partial [Acidimicrobiia bacterium]|nr:ATP-binding protein [Acidimicrobiia bacterium]
VVGWAATARAERRRATMTLERFHSALVGVATDPDLETTLASIAHGARRAVDGKFVSVLVRDAEGVMQGALEGDHDPDPKERSAEIIQRILAEPERSPSGLALVTGEPVVVRDVRTDARFSHWADESTRQGFTSTIAVPLKGARGVIGVLATYLASPSLVTDDAVRILVAYAEHAALVVQRAMAWEWERATAQRLAEADSLRTDLVATVSHELRTPLTAVHGFTETLIRHWHRFDDRERLEMLDRVLANSRELGRLIDQVLDYSHLAAGVVSVEPRPMRLDEAIREWADDRRAIAGSHQLVLEVEPVVVMASDDALDRILANLISNAAKYSPAGTTIWVRGVVEEGRAVVSVIDEGPGVPPEDRHRIFERFERGSHARSNVRGSGIGLAIVSRYVELLGGSVWVEPDPGPGAVFSFTLPSTTADVPAGDVSGVRPGAR